VSNNALRSETPGDGAGAANLHLALGAALTADGEAQLRAVLAAHGVQARARVPQAPAVAAFSLSVAPEGVPAGLRPALDVLARALGLDLVVLPRPAGEVPVRLAVMDMDSTLVKVEVIDELARAHGVVDAVSRITERAMQGELDYDTSLRLRLELRPETARQTSPPWAWPPGTLVQAGRRP
jgi:phosphoserine phosphatase